MHIVFSFSAFQQIWGGWSVDKAKNLRQMGGWLGDTRKNLQKYSKMGWVGRFGVLADFFSVLPLYK